MEAPQILIKKGGFLSSLAAGVFGLLMVSVASVTALGLYGMHIVDRRAGSLPELAEVVKGWRDVLPIADALNDRRAPEYRSTLEIATRLTPAPGGEGAHLVLEIANRGEEVVSLLCLRVTIENAEHVPVRELTITAATPLTNGDEWIGPLLPASPGAAVEPRRIARFLRSPLQPGESAHVEVTDIRVTTPLPAPAASDATAAAP